MPTARREGTEHYFFALAARATRNACASARRLSGTSSRKAATEARASAALREPTASASGSIVLHCFLSVES